MGHWLRRCAASVLVLASLPLIELASPATSRADDGCGPGHGLQLRNDAVRTLGTGGRRHRSVDSSSDPELESLRWSLWRWSPWHWWTRWTRWTRTCTQTQRRSALNPARRNPSGLQPRDVIVEGG